MPSEQLPSVIDNLAATAWRPSEARAQIDAVLGRFATDAGTLTLAAIQNDIDRIFAAPSVEAIAAALENESAAWATEARTAIARASPLSLKITFRQLQLGKGMSVAAALALEYRLTQRILAGHDFFEGIRAVLVEKDNSPRCQPASLAEVTAEDVETHFARLGTQEPSFA